MLVPLGVALPPFPVGLSLLGPVWIILSLVPPLPGFRVAAGPFPVGPFIN